MSKVKKSKKLRRPNIPLAASPSAAVGGGLEMARDLRAAHSEAAPVTFDYTYVRNDLKRIALLAGSFIVALVALSFFVR